MCRKVGGYLNVAGDSDQISSFSLRESFLKPIAGAVPGALLNRARRLCLLLRSPCPFFAHLGSASVSNAENQIDFLTASLNTMLDTLTPLGVWDLRSCSYSYIYLF